MEIKWSFKFIFLADYKWQKNSKVLINMTKVMCSRQPGGYLAEKVKLNSYSTQAFFYHFVACAFPFFKVKSVLPIDEYQNATSKAISLHELKKVCDTGFYWSSENALHERFIASSGVGV